MHRYTRKVRSVWKRLGKLLWLEGTGSHVSDLFYRAVTPVFFSVWVGVLGAIQRNDAGSGQHPCGVSKKDHLRAGMNLCQRDLEDNFGGGVPTGRWNAVGS